MKGDQDRLKALNVVLAGCKLTRSTTACLQHVRDQLAALRLPSSGDMPLARALEVLLAGQKMPNSVASELMVELVRERKK